MPNGNAALCCTSCEHLVSDKVDTCRRYSESIDNPAGSLCRDFAPRGGHPIGGQAGELLRRLRHGVLVSSTGHAETDLTPLRTFRRRNVEDRLVGDVLDDLKASLPPTFEAERGANLYYEILVDENLEVRAQPRDPRRGQSAFQTDLCVFDVSTNGVRLPRVVLEFKSDLTTHDILTYSAKAAEHKSVYPYLRYGFVLARPSVVPRRFFKHNDALDFCIAIGELGPDAVRGLVLQELAASQQLQQLLFHGTQSQVARREWVETQSIASQTVEPSQ